MIVETTPIGIQGCFGETAAGMRTQNRVSQTNCRLEEAARHFWADGPAGREAALRLFEEFTETAGALEAMGWSTDQIHEHLRPSRDVFATSSFMQRCQEWPRGYAGDFETIEHLAGGVNRSLPGTLGWHFEELLLHSPVVQQHRNKLTFQSREIACTMARNNAARIFSIGCGGCLDWLPVLPCLNGFEGEIVLNDFEPAALELAAQRLGSVTTHYRLEPGNVLRVAKHLPRNSSFDLVVAGGLFDYLSDRAIICLLRIISGLLADGGVLLFTNIGTGNPWRVLMEYGSNWTLTERSERQIRELCRAVKIDQSSVSVTRDDTGLTLITKIVKSRWPQ
jgi:SAM-dependent methyltransferase